MLIITTGIPGSGKTIWAKQFCLDTKFFRVSSDDIRHMLYDVYNIISPVEFALCEACAIALLRQRKNVVVDATNLKAKHRAAWASIARMEEHEFEVKFFDTNIATCLERNATRIDEPNYVLPDIIVRMSENMEAPHSNEGNLITTNDN